MKGLQIASTPRDIANKKVSIEQIGVGVAVAVFGLVFALGDFIPSGRYSQNYIRVLLICLDSL